MNKQELERWLAEHNYPAFIIDTNDVVRPGYEAWQKVLQGTESRVNLVIARLETFLVKHKALASVGMERTA